MDSPESGKEFSSVEKKFLLDLARKSIESHFSHNSLIPEESDLPSEKLKEKMACFVTLMIDGELRGCVGHLEAIQPLYLDVIQNAEAAAFGDFRFPPLMENEMEKIKIEISILSMPEVFEYKDSEELIEHLRKHKPGVILQKGPFRATYLPSVWENIESPEEFLSSLCLKAGLYPMSWRNGDLDIQTYTAGKFSEKKPKNRKAEKSS